MAQKGGPCYRGQASLCTTSPSALTRCHCPGCGSQRLLRCRSHPAGRGPNSSSLFPPLAAVVAVAPSRGGFGSPRKVNGFARGSPSGGAGQIIISSATLAKKKDNITDIV